MTFATIFCPVCFPWFAHLTPAVIVSAAIVWGVADILLGLVFVTDDGGDADAPADDTAPIVKPIPHGWDEIEA